VVERRRAHFSGWVVERRRAHFWRQARTHAEHGRETQITRQCSAHRPLQALSGAVCVRENTRAAALCILFACSRPFSHPRKWRSSAMQMHDETPSMSNQNCAIEAARRMSPSPLCDARSCHRAWLTTRGPSAFPPFRSQGKRGLGPPQPPHLQVCQKWPSRGLALDRALQPQLVCARRRPLRPSRPFARAAAAPPRRASAFG